MKTVTLWLSGLCQLSRQPLLWRTRGAAPGPDGRRTVNCAAGARVLLGARDAYPRSKAGGQLKVVS